MDIIVSAVTGGVDSFPTPELIIAGLASDRTYLWVVGAGEPGVPGDEKLYKMNPRDGSIISYVDIYPMETPQGLAHDGNYLWVVDSGSLLPNDEKIYKINSQNGQLSGSLDTPGDWTAGLTFDGTYLWVYEFISYDEGGKLYKLNPTDGSITLSFPVGQRYFPDLAFDSAYLWGIDSDCRPFKIDPQNGDFMGSLILSGDLCTGLTFDGIYL